MTSLATAIGFVVASFYLWRFSRKLGLNEEKVIDTMLLTAAVALLFSRVFYILIHPAFFGLDFGRWLLFLKYPGMSFAGAFLGGSAALALQGGKKALALGDLFVTPVLIVSVFGSLGLMNFGAAGAYFLLIIGHFFLRRKTLTVKPGLFTISYLITVALVSVLLAKPESPVLYYLWLALLAISGAFFVFRFRALTLDMIKFPASVLTQIKEYLEEKRSQTEKRLSALKKEDPFEDKSRLLDNADDGTEAHEKEGHERTQAVINQLNIVLIQTRKALAKINIGKYGVCEKCGQMIDTERLTVVPAATLCLACEKKKEK